MAEEWVGTRRREVGKARVVGLVHGGERAPLSSEVEELIAGEEGRGRDSEGEGSFLEKLEVGGGGGKSLSSGLVEVGRGRERSRVVGRVVGGIG